MGEEEEDEEEEDALPLLGSDEPGKQGGESGLARVTHQAASCDLPRSDVQTAGADGIKSSEGLHSNSSTTTPTDNDGLDEDPSVAAMQVDEIETGDQRPVHGVAFGPEQIWTTTQHSHQQLQVRTLSVIGSLLICMPNHMQISRDPSLK